MKIISELITILLLASLSISVSGQSDEDPPESPVFTFVTINPATSRTEMTWSLSPDEDVAGYVIYLYRDGEGYAIDTLFDPGATSYSVIRPYTDYFSESYVIAAIDSSGNISPLSNELHTIFADTKTDTCNNRINVSWDKYSSAPVKVTGYEILASVNGGTFYLAGSVSDDITNFVIEDLINDSQYCFIVKAILINSLASGSNIPCVTVRTQYAPAWINADFASVSPAGEISLSFSIDPSAETDLYSLERKSGYSGTYKQIAQIRSNFKSISYTDKTADQNIVNFYRISAINNCNIQVVSSNIASNIVLVTQNTGTEIILKWNQYRDWIGSVSSYRLFTDSGKGFAETATLEPADTAFSISIPEIMYSLTQGQVCFYISATESGNPYEVTGESISNQACQVIDEVITVPNIFTPDGDLKNDLFRPVLTFTPSGYQLVIGNRQGKTLFETSDFMEAWDGTDNGDPVPEGVYLWYLRIKTQEGKSISRTGTVTVYKN